MKTILIIIFVITGLIFAYYKYWISDSNERRLRNKIDNCLDSRLRTLESSITYQTVLKEANIFYQTQKDTLGPFAEIKVPVERVFDKYVFFSRDSSMCILMLLEKYADDFHSGNLRIIRGDLKGQWKFSVGMHMSFPEEDIESLFPEEFKAGVRQYTFDMLSKRGRISVINTGDKTKGCNFDEEWWITND